MDPKDRDRSGQQRPTGDSDTTISIEIAEWLRGLGLEQYAPAFAENVIDWEILPEADQRRFQRDRRRRQSAIAASCWRRSLPCARPRGRAPLSHCPPPPRPRTPMRPSGAS